MKKILEDVSSGEQGVEEAFKRLKGMTYEDLGFAKVDLHRSIRKGFSEVIYCAGKTPDQVAKIFHELVNNSSKVLATRADEESFQKVKELVPEARYNEVSGSIIYNKNGKEEKKGKVVVVCAGTSDLPVAEEAYETALLMGNNVEKLYDAGVAGIHRLLLNQECLANARVVIVVAGMEGALASVVGGLIEAPIIACPTSVGYGANFGGISALLTMLNSCAPGISVVNIDNGFGAGYSASLINQGNAE